VRTNNHLKNIDTTNSHTNKTCNVGYTHDQIPDALLLDK